MRAKHEQTIEQRRERAQRVSDFVRLLASEVAASNAPELELRAAVCELVIASGVPLDEATAALVDVADTLESVTTRNAQERVSC